MKLRHILVTMGLALALGCGDFSEMRGGGVPDGDTGGMGGGQGGASAGDEPCTSNAECPAGYTCQAGLCVPPEQETNHSLSESPPVATPHYVYALNPTAASVARIDPASLAIEALAVGPGPVSLSALPGEDAALVLSGDDASLSIIDSTTLPSRVTRARLPRRYGQLSVSSDGAWALVWPGSTQAPDSGAEGIFALVDVKALRAGGSAAQAITELSGGFRITDVVFRTDAGVATQVYVFAKSTISTFDLPLRTALPRRVALPESMATAISAREVVATPDGHIVMVRATNAPELASFDGAALSLVSLPEVATDLDLLPDGTAAVAALRAAEALAYIELPGDLAPGATIDLIPVPGGAVGQVALPPTTLSGGMFALVFSNATRVEAFSRVDLPSGQVRHYALEKLVDEISVSPDGASAVIIHRAEPDTEATDPYDAAVDRDEGFSVFDVATGAWQLQRTGRTKPTRYAFSPAGGYLGVALRNDALKQYAVQAVDLGSLVSQTLPLASAPHFMGTVPEAPGVTPHRVFVSQEHPAGRISVIQLDSGQVRTATGFTLNGDIE